MCQAGVECEGGQMPWGHEFNVSWNICCVCKIMCGGVNDKKDFSIVSFGEVLNGLVEVSTSRLRLHLHDISIVGNRFTKLKVIGLCMLPQNTYAQPPSMPEYKVH